MYDVTDAAFRRMFARYGKPDVMYTEFVSADGLVSKGYDKLKHHLLFDKSESPTVAQIFGINPESFQKTASLLKDLGFDGIDINMGCPERNVVKVGAGAGLCRHPEMAIKLIEATRAGAGGLPVSVKIRLGDTKPEWQPWIESLLTAKPDQITIHLRTRKEMSEVPAHWEIMPEIVKFIKDRYTEDYQPLVCGNGDVTSIAHARELAERTGCDGVMIGRGAFGKPYFFNENASFTESDKAKLLTEHLKLFDSMLSEHTHFDVMKKHFKAYFAGCPNAAEIRTKLYETKNPQEAIEVLKHV